MKTTIIGVLAAAAAAIQGIVQQGHKIEDWKTWLLPVTLAALGYLSKRLDPEAMKTLTLLACLALSSCAGLNIEAVTPWGDVHSVDGVTTVIPKPIVLPTK